MLLLVMMKWSYICLQMLYSVGFATGEGVIVVGGFYNKVARESSFAKMSLGTLPKAAFPVPNQNLKVVKEFVEALRVSQHKAIYDCFRYYNAQGGRVLTLQFGAQVKSPHLMLRVALLMPLKKPL